MSAISQPGRRALVTGATGYVGSHVLTELLEQGWAVRALCRSRDKAETMMWAEHLVPEGHTANAGQVEVFIGDAGEERDLNGALAGVDVAWYLLHSMSTADDFAQTEARMARAFARAAAAHSLSRIVYLGGLHPSSGELSEHLASRVEVGKVLLDSSTPTAALQAGVVLGDGSASFEMLRHLSERLPIAIAPDWVKHRITPISVRDAVFYLTRAGSLDGEHNRTFDIGGSDTLSYADMMKRYALTLGFLPRPVFLAPVTTPSAASHWIALVTPVQQQLARPLILSLLNNTVLKERDLETLVGEPEGGVQSFEQAIRAATSQLDTRRWLRTLGTVGACVAASEALWFALTLAARGPAKTSGALGPRLVADAALTFSGALCIADASERGDTKAKRAAWLSLAVYLSVDVVASALGARTTQRWLRAAAKAVSLAALAPVTASAFKAKFERGILSLPAALRSLF